MHELPQLWMDDRLELSSFSPGPPPYPVIWPTAAQYGLTLVRLVIGIVVDCNLHKLNSSNNTGGLVGVATRAVFKPTSYFTVCTLLQVWITWVNP